MSDLTQTRPRSPETDNGNHRPRTRRTFTETKAGFKTSEFFVMLLFVAAVLVATYSDEDSLARDDGWFYAALAAGAYIVSRGLAKLGTREPYDQELDR